MPKKNTPPTDPWSYETTVATIEGIIADLESGSLPLAAVLSQFEQAVEALNQCESYLQAKQQQVDVLIETLADS